jgi:oligoribonuclease (3'-5' exoribonuclease)
MYTVFKVFHFHRYINKWIRNAATITCKNLIGNSYDHVLQSPPHMLKRCEFLHTRNNKVSSTGVLGNPLKHRHTQPKVGDQVGNNSRKNEAAIRIASF